MVVLDPSPSTGEGGVGVINLLRSIITTLAKNLRKRSTDAERLLWRHIRGKQLEGMKFRRQEPIGSYIADFVCFEKRIIIEVDGGQHAVEKEKNATRDVWLREQGYAVFRFWNHEVLQNIEGVLQVILNHPPLTPPIEGGDT